ncbi:MAG TPA: tRNA preQ1(34) S-adenosylmethionine ribosyltransferase-isomerase QueA [Candidatus Cloacimonadota bacterium]|nr:tRNA preQ1(34) S-adenosylmethionine ribosyltransferase-isomerase QueA [Candidatus Cloacimonadota bacterium]
MFHTKKSDYYYELPTELIAQKPLADRSGSRLLYLDRITGHIQHCMFNEITSFLNSGDVLIINNTKVIPARLLGNKISSGKAEVFLLNQIDNTTWKALVRPGRRCHIGTELIFSHGLTGKIVGYDEEQTRIIEFFWEGDFWEVLDQAGSVPLPPYITHIPDETDKEYYQTIYAQEKGSVAAPTAGLHFTDELLNQLKSKGVIVEDILLHVGLGTFRPVKTDNILEHKMHKEYCQITKKTANLINTARINNKRIIAVGTTSARTLESFAQDGVLVPGESWTDLFMYPGKQFQIIDGLITNFHMPESTLLMLVAAFAGYENIMNAYHIAVEQKYRFFSYGDAMLII